MKPVQFPYIIPLIHKLLHYQASKHTSAIFFDSEAKSLSARQMSVKQKREFLPAKDAIFFASKRYRKVHAFMQLPTVEEGWRKVSRFAMSKRSAFSFTTSNHSRTNVLNMIHKLLHYQASKHTSAIFFDSEAKSLSARQMSVKQKREFLPAKDAIFFASKRYRKVHAFMQLPNPTSEYAVKIDA